MFILDVDLSSCLTHQQRERLQVVIDFWNSLPNWLSTAEETHLGVLAGLQAEVSDILSRNPLDLDKIESLTAEAALRMTGRRYC